MNNPKLKGYGFNPSDQILVGYLRDRTLFGSDYLVQDIIDLGHDICNYDPWDLPSCDSVTPNDSEQCFIYPKTLKYANSKSKEIGTPTGQVRNGYQLQPMINRATKNGKWKVSGVRVNVKSSDETKQVIGIKTRLYFKHNSCPNKTICVLHQFELVDIDPCQVRLELSPEPLVETKVTNEYEWTQSEQTNELITPCPIFDNENSIDDVNEVISNHQSQVLIELGSEPLVETEVTNEYGWTQSEQTNEFIINCPVFDNENFIDARNEVISNHKSQVRVELGSEPLVETEVTNKYMWTQSEQTNEFTTLYQIFDNDNFIDAGNEVISNHQPQVLIELGSEPLVETEVTNEYGWTQSEQTNELIINCPVFDNENFIDEGNEVISNHQSQIRVELDSESLVETEVTNEYWWTQSEQTNELTTLYPVFDNENSIDDGNEVISNHKSQINMELIRSLAVPNIGIEDQNQSYQNIGIDNDRTVPDEGSNQHNIVAVAENESSILPSNVHDHLIDFINPMEWSDLYNLCRGNYDEPFPDELPDEPQELGPPNQCGINQQVAAGAERVCTNLTPYDVAESSYSTGSVRKRSAMEFEGSGTGVETELAQQQAKRSRL
ncbi:hypothetical protein J1N35_012901 [Gossypium stocksii]|uniref:NAC domain-containing protein n=1 Tax=Gossypium stocksii TaxID=47602 RepID=A0A9D3VRH0_9ROSI|nr:hypothetical protein J1N35_012901 [Gossypium stocksii]